MLKYTRLLLAASPLLARLLASLPKVEDQTLNVPLALAWRERPYLRYHPDFLERSDRNRTWTADWLREELLHLLLRHPQRAGEFPVSWAFHLAADLEVRRYLSFEDEEVTYDRLAARLRLSEYADLAEIYQAILRLATTVAEEDDTLPAWSGSSLTRMSHAHWPVRINTIDWNAWWEPQRRLLQVVEDTHGAGQLNNLLSEPLPASKLPWQSVLRRFVSSSRRTKQRSSLRRPSRRYGILPGMRRRRTSRLAVILDTSGSISSRQRRAFFQKLQTLQRLTTNILLIEADREVRAVYPFTGTIPTTSRGGGGTHFDPALRYVNEHGPFDGVIYFTDGEGPVPTVRCHAPLLWVLNTPQLSDSEYWPGAAVCFHEHPRERQRTQM